MSRNTLCHWRNIANSDGTVPRIPAEIDNTLVVDLQASVLDDLPSRVMVPLYPAVDMAWSISRLNPRFRIDGKPHAMATQRMAAIPTSETGPEIDDLSKRSDDIVAATDFLFQGF